MLRYPGVYVHNVGLGGQKSCLPHVYMAPQKNTHVVPLYISPFIRSY